jgi:hypothetical protein
MKPTKAPDPRIYLVSGHRHFNNMGSVMETVNSNQCPIEEYYKVDRGVYDFFTFLTREVAKHIPSLLYPLAKYKLMGDIILTLRSVNVEGYILSDNVFRIGIWKHDKWLTELWITIDSNLYNEVIQMYPQEY